jgi:hypothetical protein
MFAVSGKPILWAGLCLLGVLLIFVPAMAYVGGYDFLPIYTAARLLRSGAIYAPELLLRTEGALAGVKPDAALLYVRPPAYALFAWPLSLLNYPAASAAWIALRIAAMIGFVLLWPHNRRAMTALVCCWALPAAAALASGQDTPLLLLWIALSERLARTRPFAAGLALAMCASKFHLFLLLPVLLVVHRRALIYGFLSGAAGLTAISFAAAGWRWPIAYAALLRDPQLTPLGKINIHALGLPPGVEIALCVAVAAGAVAVILRGNHRLAWIATLAGGIALSYHASLGDTILLVPAALLAGAEIAARGRFKPARASASPDR